MQRQRRSHAEMSALLARRDSEGVTFKQLAADSGVPLGTLLSWSRKLRTETTAPATREQPFIELATEPASELELRLPSGATISIRPGFDPALLRELVAALAC